MSQRHVDDDHAPLPDEVAQRIMARAIELDSMHASGTTTAKLREIALEAGVSVEAFDQALLERLHSSIQQAPSFPATGRAGPEAEALIVRLWKGLILNLAVLGGWWLSAAIVLVFLRESIGLKGQADVALVAVTFLLGLEFSLRMRARIVAIILAVCGATEIASLVYAAISRQSHINPAQMMAAALCGVGFGFLLSRRFGRGSKNTPQAIMDLSPPSPATAPKPERKPRWPFLRIRLGGAWIEGSRGIHGRVWRARAAT